MFVHVETVVCVVIPAWKQGVACVLLHSPEFFQRRSPSCPDTCFTERPVATSHQSWGHCIAIGGEGNSVNFRWTSLILSPPSLAPGHSLLGFPPGKQLWQNAPGWVPACSPLSRVCWGSQAWLWCFPVLLDGIPLLSICMGMTSPLCKSKGRGSYARVLHWFTRGKSLPLLLMANSLAFQSGEHPVLEGKGHEQSCFKHLISRAVPNTFDHFPIEGSNSQNCFASTFHCKGKITRFDISFPEQSAWGFLKCFAYFLFAVPVPNYLKYF